MLRFTYSTRLFVILLSAFLMTIIGCRKKINFDQTDSTDSGTLHPLQQYYEPWETVSVSTKGTPYMIEANTNYLYIASDDGNRRWIEYITPNHNINTLFFSETYQFTSMNRAGFTRMVLGASGGQNGVATFDHTGLINTYSFYIPSGSRINSIYDNAVRFYIGGNFLNFGASPASKFGDRIYSLTGDVLGSPGVVSEIFEMDRVQMLPYGCGNSILPSGHSIAEWVGSAWEARTPIVNKKVTCIEEIGDTLFIGGFGPNEFAIKKFANGVLITDSTIVNTSTSLNASDVKMVSQSNVNVLYVYGTVNFQENLYTGVLKYTNGEWSYVGKLGSVPDDVAIFNGYLYALTNGQLKRFPL